MKEIFRDYLNGNTKLDKKTMCGIFFLVIIISGVVGWIYEFIFYYFNSGMTQFYLRGSNFLPWINIYMFGGGMLFFLTYKKLKKPLQVFLIAVISTGILEYLTGWALLEFKGLRYWNYNLEILNFGNISGFVCLRSVLLFGLFSLLLMYLIVPSCFYLAKKINRKTFLLISYILCIVFLFDGFYNIILSPIFDLPNAIDIYKSLGFRYLSF